MLGALILASLGLGSFDGITLQSGCERLPILLKQVSEQSKTELRCRPSLEDEVLFVSVKDKPVDKLKSDVAAVCHAEWRKEGGAEWLTRTAAQEARDRKNDQAVTLAAIRSALEPKRNEGLMTAMSPSAEGSHLQGIQEIHSQLMADTGMAPEQQVRLDRKRRDLTIPARGLSRLLLSCDLSSLASQPPWESRLYSLSPNRYQYPLGGKAANAVAPFTQEQNYLINLVRGLDDEARKSSLYSLGAYGDYHVPIVEPVGIYVFGQCFAGEFLEMEALFVDADGYLIDLNSSRLPLWEERDPAKSFPGIENWGSERLSYSERALLTIARTRNSGPSQDPSTARPADRDPLSFWFDDPLVQLAQTVRQDIVAALPDEILHATGDSVGVGKSLRDLCGALAKYESVKAENGCLLMEPLKRAEAYDLRTRRKPLQDLLAIARTRPPTLVEAGTYALAQNDFAGSTSLEGTVVDYNGANGAFLEWLSGNALAYRERAKFYATLSPSQRARLVEPGLQYSELTAPQRQIFDFWTYSCWTNLNVTHSQLDPKRGYMMLDRYASISLPGGIPPGTTIHMKIYPDKAALVASKDGRKKVESCSSIGYILFQQTAGTFGPELGYQNIESSVLTPAIHNTYGFTVNYTPIVSDAFTLHDASVQSTAPVAWKDLPSEWLKPLTDTLNYYRKNVIGGTPRTPVKPPPPRFGAR